MGQGLDRFRAFVSYAHADAAQAGRLQRRLEHYRIPDALGETLQLEGARSGSIGPIFRDREDLSAASDLSEAVRDALAASQALVVVCTPATPKSRWVDREIALFRELHPDRPVLAALFDGEPAEAFPPALTAGGVEPLAADFRAAGDGDRLAFLKVVAGVLQVPLDRLIQRDAQRRVRRVTAVTAASLALVLAMGAMTMFAIQSRNEAQAQREEAEGLIEFMLTDLRTELRGVGRLDVMDGVNKRAMDYYEGQGDLSEFPADSLERRARLMHAMGEDAEKSGDYARARRYFVQAHRQTAELLARSPDNPDRIFAHAQSEYWLGYAGWQANDFARARDGWEGYLEQATTLYRKEPRSARASMEMGYAHGNMCELSMRQGHGQEALDHCRHAIRYQREAIGYDPSNKDYRMALANRYGWLADVLFRLDRFDDAADQREKESGIVRQLLEAEPDNAEFRLRSVYPVAGLVELQLARGAESAALPLVEAAKEQLAELAHADPENRHVSALQLRLLIMETRALRRLGHDGWSVSHEAARRLFEDWRDDEGGPVARLAGELAMLEREMDGER